MDGASRIDAVEANALKAPEFQIKGATPFDQKWVDETTEAGVAALGWERPGPRPPEWDKPLAKAKPAAKAAAAAPKKKRWRDRIKDRLFKKPVS